MHKIDTTYYLPNLTMRLLLFALSVILPAAVRGAEIIYGPEIDLTFTWGYVSI